jgi:hypothetical protein
MMSALADRVHAYSCHVAYHLEESWNQSGDGILHVHTWRGCKIFEKSAQLQRTERHNS